MNNNAIRPSEGFLSSLGIEEQINLILDGDKVRNVILAKFKQNQEKLDEIISRIEKFGQCVNEAKKACYADDEEVFTEWILCSASEEIEDSLWILSKYLVIDTNRVIAGLTLNDSEKLLESVSNKAEASATKMRSKVKEITLQLIVDQVDDEEFNKIMDLLSEDDDHKEDGKKTD